jgi:hypothetical protein
MSSQTVHLKSVTTPTIAKITVSAMRTHAAFSIHPMMGRMRTE